MDSNGASDNGVEKVIEQNMCNITISDAAKRIRGRLWKPLLLVRDLLKFGESWGWRSCHGSST